MRWQCTPKRQEQSTPLELAGSKLSEKAIFLETFFKYSGKIFSSSNGVKPGRYVGKTKDDTLNV